MLVVLLSLAAVAPAVAAEPLVARAALPRKERTAIDDAIAQARRRSPDVFAAVARILDEAAVRAESRRGGPFAAISPELEALGPDASWALADHLLRGPHAASGARLTTDASRPAVDAARLADDDARLTADVGAITAAGASRNPRLRPLWVAILDSDERPDVLRSAAEALARTCDARTVDPRGEGRLHVHSADRAARLLVRRAAGDGPAAHAVQAAMGACRQRAVATALAAQLDAARDPDEARRLIGALAELGADWAWQTPSLRDNPERDALRAIAATALQRAATHRDPDIRAAAARARRVVVPPAR